MDPITLIITALATGDTLGSQAVASEAIKDAYHGLKDLIARRLATKPEAELVVTKYEEKPDVWKAPLEDMLKAQLSIKMKKSSVLPRN